MDRFSLWSMRVGRILFGVALFGIGIQHIILGDFIIGRAPAWPVGIPGRMVWACVTGILMMIPLPAIIIGKAARNSLLTCGVVIFGWAFLRHIPVLLSNIHSGLEWTNTGKALALSGGAFILAASFSVNHSEAVGRSGIAGPFSSQLLLPGRIFVGIFFIIGAIQHFIYADFVKFLVPGWIPGGLFWTYFAGVALAAGGLGLISGILLRQAAMLSGSMIFLWVVLLHASRVLTIGDANEWTALFEAMAFSSSMLVLGGRLYRDQLLMPPLAAEAQ